MPERDDYFDEAPGRPGSEAPAGDKGKGEEDSDRSTALLPKSFFGGSTPEIGDTCEVRVEQILDEEVAVSYVEHKEEEEPEEEGTEVPAGAVPGSAGGGMGGMLD